ncbi:hypothetical protein SCHPADRAFT_839052 [Schizopora paradoxa]|uniref:protein-tyrosine-phosphatase n=1 Tax=Schizopora paradoxa TaxID=27342 RepID=A0A0H2R1Q9_9AGAM|nr:hypothetical protein SCHPADRAFT_839052 [Schizopora paradoxa]
MDQVCPNLWIGSLLATRDVEKLRANNIRCVLSTMRGSVKIHETFIHRQVQLDDTTDADALALFPQCIEFIEKELEKGHGVLVHCHAGLSRSATIVAAYLMYANQIDAATALERLRKVRPATQPNEGFLEQLEVFYEASFKVSRHSKATRMYYLERALEEVMRGGGAVPEDNMFAKFPRTPSDSAPPTPGGPRRRIRCKMCRTELAAREHMLDHGQVGPETPASATPAVSRRPSAGTQERPLAFGFTPIQPPSRSASHGASMQERLAKTMISDDASSPARRLSHSVNAKAGSIDKDLQPLVPSLPLSRRASGTTRSRRPSTLVNEISALREGITASPIDATNEGVPPISENANEDNNTSALDTDSEDEEDQPEPAAAPSNPPPKPQPTGGRASVSRPSNLTHGSDLAAQLDAHPKLAALRSPAPLSTMGGIQPMTKISTPAANFSKSPPLLINNTCSGYFLEPMKWMEPFLEKGSVGGKIICPNKKCGAKLGNFDWAGVQCSCKQWVTPGFCIARSKVDEIV